MKSAETLLAEWRNNYTYKRTDFGMSLSLEDIIKQAKIDVLESVAEWHEEQASIAENNLYSAMASKDDGSQSTWGANHAGIYSASKESATHFRSEAEKLKKS